MMIYNCPHCNHSSYQAGEVENPVCTNPKCQKFKNDPVLQEGEMEMSVRRDIDLERIDFAFKGSIRRLFFKPGTKAKVKLNACIEDSTGSEINLPIKEARELFEFPEEVNKQLAKWHHIGADFASEKDHSAVHIVQAKTPTDGPNKNGDDFSSARQAVKQRVAPFYYDYRDTMPQPGFDSVQKEMAKCPPNPHAPSCLSDFAPSDTVEKTSEFRYDGTSNRFLQRGDFYSTLNGEYKVTKSNSVCKLGDTVRLLFRPNIPFPHGKDFGFTVSARDCDGETRIPFFATIRRTFDLLECAERMDETNSPYPKVIARFEVMKPVRLVSIGILPVGTIINVTAKDEATLFSLIQIILPGGETCPRYSCDSEIDDIISHSKQVEVPKWEGD